MVSGNNEKVISMLEVTFFIIQERPCHTNVRKPFLYNKKDAPQDAQLAKRKIIATQYRSRAESAQTRNLFFIDIEQGTY